MFLTVAELAELTDASAHRLQMRWLDANGWPYEVSRMGRPKVLRAYAERRLGLVDASKTAHTEPDFSHWKTAA